MTCDDARRLLSDRADGELAAPREPELDEHLVGCPACRAHQVGLDQLRAHLASDPFPPPDLAGRVMIAVRREQATAVSAPQARRRGLVPVAAAFVGAALAGALLVGSADRGDDAASADLAASLAVAQTRVEAVSATVVVEERGLHSEVPERRLSGPLRYSAPEALSLRLTDRTDYPSTDWPSADVVLVVDDDRWMASGLRDCPAVDQPGCLPATPVVREVSGREPFAATTPVPLDLITPVQSFSLAGTSVTLEEEDVDGRETVGVEVTAAQVEPLLEGLRPAGNLRQVNPSDLVELRLDEETLVPLAITVRAAPGALRQRWADARGYADEAGAEVLDVRLQDVRFGDEADAPDRLPSTTTVPEQVSAGFRDGPAPLAAQPAAAALGALRPHRSGQLATPDGPTVHVRTWSDGRAWLAVRATDEWTGGRLFGDLGSLVRSVPLEDGGVAYLSQDGRSIGLHGAEVDLVVTGSLDRGALVAVASTLGIEGLAVPDDWDEAAAATRADVLATDVAVLLPDDLDGFDAPSFRIDGPPESASVRASFQGQGGRSFVLVQSAGERLAPPLDTADVVAVDLGGTTGRFSPLRGLLEWVDEATVRSLQSTSLGLDELRAIAIALAPT